MLGVVLVLFRSGSTRTDFCEADLQVVNLWGCGDKTGGGKGLNPRLWLKAAVRTQLNEGKSSTEATTRKQRKPTHTQPPRLPSRSARTRLRLRAGGHNQGQEQRGHRQESRGAPGSRPAPPQPPLPAPPLSRRDARSCPELRRAAGGECPRGARVAQTQEAGIGARLGRMRCGVQGTKWRRVLPFTLSPHLGVWAERVSDRCWGRGATAAREGLGFL